MEEEECHLTLWEHCDALRSALLKTVISISLTTFLAFYFSDSLLKLLKSAIPPEQPLLLLSPQEGIRGVFSLSFWTGACLSLPYWSKVWLNFIKPALRGKARSLLPAFLLLSLLFITGGILFALKITIPAANQYLFDFNDTIGLNAWSFSHYIDYVWLLLLAHVVAFLAGALLLILIHLQVIGPKQLQGKRKHAFLASLVLGAILTPPDVLTQIALAAPLYLFYELGLLYSRFSSLRGCAPNRSCHAHPDKDAIPPSDNQTPREDF